MGCIMVLMCLGMLTIRERLINPLFLSCTKRQTRLEKLLLSIRGSIYLLGRFWSSCFGGQYCLQTVLIIWRIHFYITYGFPLIILVLLSVLSSANLCKHCFSFELQTDQETVANTGASKIKLTNYLQGV